ncbi:hypothetical protein WG8_4551 [Paenibacillus sp. Aloe-11]|nr:hypothetical protein WG8_4551 [Paenibacillus sp. Aloe-11]
MPTISAKRKQRAPIEYRHALAA